LERSLGQRDSSNRKKRYYQPVLEALCASVREGKEVGNKGLAPFEQPLWVDAGRSPNRQRMTAWGGKQSFDEPLRDAEVAPLAGILGDRPGSCLTRE
jgi:hypothetical protein